VALAEPDVTARMITQQQREEALHLGRVHTLRPAGAGTLREVSALPMPLANMKPRVWIWRI